MSASAILKGSQAYALKQDERRACNDNILQDNDSRVFIIASSTFVSLQYLKAQLSF